MSHQHPLSRPPRRFRRLAHLLRRNRGLTTRLLLLAILFPVVLWLFTSSVAARTSFGLPDSLLYSPQQQNPGAVQNVLLITAHPDDEALFFGPTILQLTRHHPNIRLSLLVMSAGNHYHLGPIRKQEQLGSCTVLGITNCEVLDHPDLQDDPKADWPEEVIQDLAREYVRRWVIDAIITFDPHGISSHPNHISVSRALLASPPVPLLYTLTSVSLPRKYSSLVDFPLTLLSYLWTRTFSYHAAAGSMGTAKGAGAGRAALAISGLGSWARNVRAFQQHRSQNTWDRHLYAVVSRYMWFNELRFVED